jgi:hypothetical protein
MIGTNAKKLVLIVLLLIFFFSVISFPAFSQGKMAEKLNTKLSEGTLNGRPNVRAEFILNKNSDEFDIIGHFPDGRTESVKRIEQE